MVRAADVVQTVPTARLVDAVLPAVRMVSQRNLSGLVVVDEQDRVVACVSSAELLGLLLPRYMRDEPCLARMVDEVHADRIAAALGGTAVRDVVGAAADGVPVVRADATLVEVAEVMARRCCPLVVVEGQEGGTLGVVTANRLIEILVGAAVGEMPR